MQSLQREHSPLRHAVDGGEFDIMAVEGSETKHPKNGNDDDMEAGFVRPMLINFTEMRPPGTYKITPNSMLIHAPGGMLDLSLYNYQPLPHKDPSCTTSDGKRPADAVIADEETVTTTTTNTTTAVAPQSSKKKRFKAPRRNSKLEKLIALLEDRRIMEGAEGAQQLEDIQMPRLRNVLNIIFITAGVGFLLAVVIVILYTTFTR